MYNVDDNFVKKIYRNTKQRISWDDVKPNNATQINELKISFSIGNFSHLNAYRQGTNMYVKILRINGENRGIPLMMDVATRGGHNYRVKLTISNNNFKFERTPIMSASLSGNTLDVCNLYLVKAGNMLFDLYASNIGNYNVIDIYGNYIILGYDSLDQVEVTSLPTGYVSPTEVSYIP